MKDYNKKTIVELKKECKEKGLLFDKKAKKEDLIKLLENVNGELEVVCEQVEEKEEIIENKPVEKIDYRRQRTPNNFVKEVNIVVQKGKKGFYKGRFYENIDGYTGKWLDNGNIFNLDIIK